MVDPERADRPVDPSDQPLLERLKLVREAAEIGVFDDDLEEAHIEWDERMRSIWGVGPYQPITRDLFSNSILPEDRPLMEAAFAAACDPAGNRRLRCEYRVRRQNDGKIRHVAVTGIVTIRDGRARRLVGSARDVSASREAEAKRAATFALAEGLLETAPTLIYIYDLVDRSTIHLSPQAIDIVGMCQADLDRLGGGVIDALMHPEDLDRIEQHHAAIRSGLIEPPFEIEYRLRHRDGHHIWLASKEVVHLRDGQGRPRQILGASLDITAVKAAADAAKANARLLQSVVDAVPFNVFIKDREGRYLLANEAAAAVIGRPWEAIEGRTDAEWTPPDQLGPIQEADRFVIESGTTREAEEQFHHDEIGPRTFLTRKTPLRNDLGEVVGVIGAGVDVTDRVRASAEIARSEARLRLVLDQLFAFVGVTSPDGALLWANRAPLELAGLSAEDVLGRPFWTTHWWSWSEEAQERVKAAMERAALGEVVRFDIPVLFTDAEPKMIDFQVAPLVDEAGRVRNLIPSGILIEDRVQAERGRELLIAELHHRIKNLYTIATGMVQRSAKSAADKDELVRSVSGRLMAMARAHDLIRPAEDGQQAPVPLHDLLLQILPHHADSPGRIRLDGPALLLDGEAVTPVALILHELATNAAKYGALGADKGHVTVGWEVTACRLILRWQEQGGPPIADRPGQDGFGSTLIRTSAERQLFGSIQRSWTDSGCLVVLDVPARWVVGAEGC